MIEFAQVLKDIDYKNAAYIHSGRNKFNFLITGFGILLAAAGMVTANYMAFHFSKKFTALFIVDIGLVVYGLILIFRKYFYAGRVLKNAKRGNGAGVKIIFAFRDNGTCVASENNEESEADIKDFYGYFLSGDYLLLYPQKKIFFIIKKQAGLEQKFYDLVKLFEKLRIKSL
jgi:hypothetical protein